MFSARFLIDNLLMLLTKTKWKAARVKALSIQAQVNRQNYQCIYFKYFASAHTHVKHTFYVLIVGRIVLMSFTPTIAELLITWSYQRYSLMRKAFEWKYHSTQPMEFPYEPGLSWTSGSQTKFTEPFEWASKNMVCIRACLRVPREFK